MAYYNRGAIYIKQGELEKALKDLNKAIQIHPNKPIIYVNRSVIHSKQGNRSKTIEDLEKAKILYQKQGKTETKEYQRVQQMLDKLH